MTLFPLVSTRARSAWAFLTLSSVAALAGAQTPSDADPLGYFSVSPCRVVDTRRIGHRRIGGPRGTPMLLYETRGFRLRGPGLSDQGGNKFGCAVPSEALAAMLNVAAVSPMGPGHLRVWASPLPMPGVSTLQYGAVAGLDTIANGIAVPVCDTRTDTCLADFMVFNYGSVTHLVVDVVGYFAPAAVATAGPEGPPGVAGPSGPQGLQGEPGAKGEPGEKGAVGDQGLAGSQGPPGAQGIPGLQGERGPQGSPGAQGPTGPKGKTGATGDRGPAVTTFCTAKQTPDSSEACNCSTAHRTVGLTACSVTSDASRCAVNPCTTCLPRQLYALCCVCRR
jgi:hypothetical protein